MSSSMVVMPEPSVKACGAFCRAAVDRPVGPASEHRADESLRLPVGLGPVGAGAQVADAKRPARERMRDRDIGPAVVGEELLDLDAVTTVKRPRSDEEGDRR